MKQRMGFVSNSSSTSFCITNISKETKTLVDFVTENPQLVKDFLTRFDWHTEEEGFTQEAMLRCAETSKLCWKPGEKRYCVFGDEQGTVVGHVFDYMLRNGGKSKSFKWKLNRYLR